MRKQDAIGLNVILSINQDTQTLMNQSQLSFIQNNKGVSKLDTSIILSKKYFYTCNYFWRPSWKYHR